MEEKNIPYRKQYDEDGQLIKVSNYMNMFPNRRERRSHLQKSPFMGNKKGISLVVTATSKYEKKRQFIKLMDKAKKKVLGIKTIFHYLDRNKSK